MPAPLVVFGGGIALGAVGQFIAATACSKCGRKKLRAPSAATSRPAEGATTSSPAKGAGPSERETKSRTRGLQSSRTTASFPVPVTQAAQAAQALGLKLVVAGAGGDGESVNGAYSVVETFNGRPKYKKDSGDAIVYFQDNWKINYHDGAEGWYYYHISTSMDLLPPQGQWTSDHARVDPGPTVTIQGAEPLEGETKHRTRGLHLSAPASTPAPAAQAAQAAPLARVSLKSALGLKFVVADAGGDGESVNGAYSMVVDTFNGRPKYKKDSGHAILFFDNIWKINWQDDTAGWYYSYTSTAMDVPGGQWTSDHPRVDPAPTVTLQSVHDNSDFDDAAHQQDHGSRPEEWRLWLPDTPEARAAFDAARDRMGELIRSLEKPGGESSGFKSEVPRVDQYFCAGSKIGPKAATRAGRVEMEVKNLTSVSEEGSEAWEKATGVDLSTYTQMPWVALQKTRNRCKAKKVAKATVFAGLKALECTEIRVVQDSIFPDASGCRQPLQADAYLTIAVEGLPAIIAKTVAELRLEELSALSLSNADGVGRGLYQLNVSYPRFIDMASAAPPLMAYAAPPEMAYAAPPEMAYAAPPTQQVVEADAAAEDQRQTLLLLIDKSLEEAEAALQREKAGGHADNGAAAVPAQARQAHATPVFAHTQLPAGHSEEPTSEDHELKVFVGGSSYKGQMSDGLKHGQGRFTYPNGDVYDGEWQQDQAHGLGVFTAKDLKYEGQWENDLKHGQAVEAWDDSSSYRGTYVEGQKQGFGVFSWPDGSVYTGEFNVNNVEGEGTFTWKDSRKYQGQWLGNHMHGHGKYEWPDKRVFEGQYINDVKEGEGTFLWSDGRRFVGQWKDGKQNGVGVFRAAGSDKERRGEWREGVRVCWLDD